MAIEPKIFEEVTQILAGFGDDYLTDRGALKRGRLIEDLDKYKPVLMKELLGSELIRKSYVETIEVADKKHELFKLNQFVELFTYKEYWADSYTKFSNKIGLTAGGKFIDETADVVLDFPFKDCVLKAGMTKEDAKDVDEAFLNEVIAKPEIDTLLEPKIFVNAKRYNKENLEGVPTEDFDENDNLIIKGNNLIALHSIKERYAGKVKLIYIDPPYYFSETKQSDSFPYNSNFKLSTWLTFIQNRLEIAKELLSEDGILLVSIDEDGQAYLKILLEQVFQSKNFLSTLIWNLKTGTTAGHFTRSHEYILSTSKNKELLANFSGGEGVIEHSALKKIGVKNPASNFTFPVGTIFEAENDKNFQGTWGGSESVTLVSGEVKIKDGKLIEPVTLSAGWAMKGQMTSWFNGEETFDSKGQKVLEFSFNSKGILRYKKERSIVNPKTVIDDVGSTKNGTTHLNNLLGSGKFNFPKNEDLLSKLIGIVTEEKDIVLDFFMGSATTQAVAMKMKRRFIGIEQMDYINSVSVERLKKVIDGEQGGISKAVDWQGGGSFVYAELFEKNQGYLKDLLKASDTIELNAVYERMLEGGADFDFRVDLGKFEEEKAELSFEKQKEFLIKIIDKNQLYYQYSEIEDENVRELISDSDLKFNEKFYGEEHD